MNVKKLRDRIRPLQSTAQSQQSIPVSDLVGVSFAFSMDQIVAFAPAVFDKAAAAWDPVAGLLAGPSSGMTAEHFGYMQIYLMVLFVGTGVLKLLNPAPLKKKFKCLPDWSWTLGGLVEIVGCYFFYTGQLDIALPVFYTFLGAVIYTVLQSASTMMIAPFPMSTVCLVFMYGKNAGVDSSGWIYPCALVGAFMTAMLSTTVESKKAKRS